MSIVLSLLVLSCCNLIGYPAFVAKPVIDLLGQSKEAFKENVYQTLPYSWDKSVAVCPRIYQLMLHEVVDVVEEYDQEIKLTVPGVYYLKQGCLCNEYWTLKENVIPLSTDSEHVIPQENNECVKTLIHNFHDAECAIELSSGTRFVVAAQVDDCYEVNFYNHHSQSCQTMMLNKNLFFEPSENCIADFIRILRTYCEDSQGFVPYLWGGASNAYRLQQAFALVENDEGGYWKYDHEDRETKSGFDCSALILRAARIAGLPFKYRNTATMAWGMEQLQATDAVEQGDTLYFKGHVCVVSDVENNLCIESRGYGQGYGRVHEIQIQDLFHGINNFDELKNAYLRGDSIKLYDIKKNYKDIADFRILKLRSIFNADAERLGSA